MFKRTTTSIKYIRYFFILLFLFDIHNDNGTFIWLKAQKPPGKCLFKSTLSIMKLPLKSSHCLNSTSSSISLIRLMTLPFNSPSSWKLKHISEFLCEQKKAFLASKKLPASTRSVLPISHAMMTTTALSEQHCEE